MGLICHSLSIGGYLFWKQLVASLGAIRSRNGRGLLIKGWHCNHDDYGIHWNCTRKYTHTPQRETDTFESGTWFGNHICRTILGIVIECGVWFNPKILFKWEGSKVSTAKTTREPSAYRQGRVPYLQMVCDKLWRFVIISRRHNCKPKPLLWVCLNLLKRTHDFGFKVFQHLRQTHGVFHPRPKLWQSKIAMEKPAFRA